MDILQNKNYKNYNYLSRYASFPYYFNILDKKYIYSTTSQLKKNISYIIHEVKDNESLDDIALYYYNNPTFFWVLADFNNIQDPYMKLNLKSSIKVPSLSSLSFEVN